MGAGKTFSRQAEHAAREKPIPSGPGQAVGKTAYRPELSLTTHLQSDCLVGYEPQNKVLRRDGPRRRHDDGSGVVMKSRREERQRQQHRKVSAA